MNTIKIFIIFLLFISCEKKEKINPNQVIVSGKVLEYDDLEIKDIDQVCEYCVYYVKNWYLLDSFDPKTAYYIKIRLNNQLLAKLTESEVFKINYLLSKNSYSLYGKYHNRIILFDEFGFQIPETEKFEGQTIIDIKRIGNYDEVFIGPILYKPKKIVLEIHDSKNYKGINPSFIF